MHGQNLPTKNQEWELIINIDLKKNDRGAEIFILLDNTLKHYYVLKNYKFC